MNAVDAAGAADPQVVALIHGISDERVAPAAATTRFTATAAKSDVLEDNDVSAPSKRARESTRDEDARLHAGYARLEKARETLATFGAASFGGPTASSSLLSATLEAGDEVDLEETLPRSTGGLMHKVRSISVILIGTRCSTTRWISSGS